jgi:hypothetical protein
MLKYLKQFEKRHYGPVTNLFLHVIRERPGYEDKDRIICGVRKELESKKRYRPLAPHYKLVEESLNTDEDLDEYINYYVKYSTFTDSDKKRAKSIKSTEKRKIRELKDFINEGRPMSWSAMASFHYDPWQFFDKYVLRKRQETNPAMEFGKEVGNKLISDPAFLPDVLRYPVFEQQLKGKVMGIPIIGFLDSFDPETKNFYEYKTSSNPRKWTAKTAQEHGQLMFYKLLIHLNYKVRPEDIDCKLFYIPCEETEDFKVKLSGEKVQSFDVKHTTADIIAFGRYMVDTYKKMEEFVRNN